MTALQDSLYSALNSSKENKISQDAKQIKPYIFSTLQLIDKNRKEKLSNEEKISKIFEICGQYKSTGKRKKSIKPSNVKDIDSTLCRHGIIYDEINERIHNSLEIAAEELGINISFPTQEEKDVLQSESDNSYAFDEDSEPELKPRKPPQPFVNTPEEEEEEEEAQPKQRQQQQKQQQTKNPQPRKQTINNLLEEEEEEEDSDVFVEENAPVVIRRN